ncbi:MAG: DUF1778 domain-containing protein [Polynucleobacter sp.]|nr:DUF1778 domain-containing protein [Polynucleobacter sp.]
MDIGAGDCDLAGEFIRMWQIDVQLRIDSQKASTMSAATHSPDTARINLRTSPEAKALIERAAALMGTTVSGFMVQNAYEAAQRLVSQHETITLSDRDRDVFLAALENPPEPTEALRRLMARR